MRYAWLAGPWLVLGLAMGCESAEEQCAKARVAASSEWDAYLQVLEGARAETAAAQKMAALRMTAIEARLAPRSRARADARYAPGSDAWLRANTSAFNELCGVDQECLAQRQQRFESSTALKDLDERLALVRAARAAADGDPDAAGRASAAVILHPEYPRLKQAQALSGELRKRCQGVAAPAEGDALSSAQR